MSTPDREHDARGLDERLAALLKGTLSGDTRSDPLLGACELSDFDGEPHPAMGGVVLLAKLDRGGMAQVYLGHHTRLDLPVAVKVIARHTMHSPSAVSRFVQEARLAARLRSEHLVRVYDVDEDPRSGLFFIVMELVEGANAAAWAAEEGVVAEREALELCIAAARGLEVAHVHEPPIVHRDVKPGNLLVPLGRDGRPDVRATKLADLGLAKLGDDAPGWTATNAAMGTPGYMAPEQFEDVHGATRAADVFGLGATLYALLAGSAPFEGTSTLARADATRRGDYRPLHERRPDVSAETEAVIDRCLRGEPAERFASARELREALEDRLDACSGLHAPTSLLPDGRGRAAAASPRRSRAAWLVGSSLALAALAWFFATMEPDLPADESGAAAALGRGPIDPPLRDPEPEPELPDSATADDAGLGADGPSAPTGGPGPLATGLLEAAEAATSGAPQGPEGGPRRPEEPVAGPPPLPRFDALRPGDRPAVRDELTVEGRLASFDPELHELVLDGERLPVAPDGSFRRDVDLGSTPAGAFALALEVRTLAGEVLARGAVEGIVDRAPPELVLTEPATETCHVAAPTATLVGTVEAGADLRVDGRPVAIEDDGAFTHEVRLRPGENAVAIRATDAAGNVHERTLRWFLDDEDPRIEDAQARFDATAATWRIRGRVVDERPARVRLGAERHACGPDGSFELDLATDAARVTLVGVDRAGRESEPLELALDRAPPTIDLDAWEPAGFDPEIVLTGRIDERAGIELLELDPDTRDAIGVPRAGDVAARAIDDEDASAAFAFSVRATGSLGLDEVRAFRLTAIDAHGNDAEVEVDLFGPVPIGTVEQVRTERGWVVVASEQRHRDVLEAVDARRKLDPGATLAILEDGSIVRVAEVHNLVGNRRLTARPGEGFAIRDFEGKEGQPVYWLSPMRSVTSSR